MGRVEAGSTVSLDFTLSLTDGTRVEGTEPGRPWQVVLGHGALPEGLERCLLGLAVGDRGRFLVAAADAFGVADDHAREILPRDQFPTDAALIPGMAYGFSLPDGEEVLGQIMAVSPTGVEVDFSHPLAGHDVVFEVEIVAIGVC
ncbi:MAG: FKBP-type peptidyl-prolyl cis-trans isomerase [Acidiferrobacter sp.]